MLILILMDVQYLQNVVFSFEKGLNGPKHSPSDSHHPIQKLLWLNFPFPCNGGDSPNPLMLFGKRCTVLYATVIL